MLLIAIRHSDPQPFARLVTFVCGGDQSHTEAAIPFTGQPHCWCVSSSWMDGGVRDKFIDLSDLAKWRVYLWSHPHANLRDSLEKYKGWKYDHLGLLGILWRPIGHALHRLFCSEFNAMHLQLKEPHLYDPRGLESVVASLGTRVVYKDGTWVPL